MSGDGSGMFRMGSTDLAALEDRRAEIIHRYWWFWFGSGWASSEADLLLGGLTFTVTVLPPEALSVGPVVVIRWRYK